MDPAIEVSDSATALDAAQLLVKWKAHRIVVRDKNLRPTNLITQSRIIKCASTMLDGLEIAKKTIQELGIGSKDVFTVKLTDDVRNAFKLMIEKVSIS